MYRHLPNFPMLCGHTSKPRGLCVVCRCWYHCIASIYVCSKTQPIRDSKNRRRDITTHFTTKNTFVTHLVYPVFNLVDYFQHPLVHLYLSIAVFRTTPCLYCDRGHTRGNTHHWLWSLHSHHSGRYCPPRLLRTTC